MTEVPLKSALILCHLMSCTNTGMQEHPDPEQGQSPMLTMRLQSSPPRRLLILVSKYKLGTQKHPYLKAQPKCFGPGSPWE